MSTSLTEKLLSAPPVAVAGASIMGYSLSEWAALVTILYTLVLLYFRLRKEYSIWKAKRSGKPDLIALAVRETSEDE